MEEPGDVDARFFFWNIYVLGMKSKRPIRGCIEISGCCM